MHWFIVLFGTAMALTGAVILFNPKLIFGPLGRKAQSTGIYVMAIAVRILLGLLLVLLAERSRYPAVIEVLGWIFLAAAIALMVIGRQRFGRLMGWALGLADRMGRGAGVAAIVFGAFLVHAFL